MAKAHKCYKCGQMTTKAGHYCVECDWKRRFDKEAFKKIRKR